MLGGDTGMGDTAPATAASRSSRREPLLLGGRGVRITPPIRHRLVTVVFLGVVTSGLSLVALVRLLSTATTQRIERGREFVAEETARLAQAAPPDRHAALGQWPRSQVMGMRGGYIDRHG